MTWIVRSLYTAKTNPCLYTRIKEHSSYDSFEIFNHVINCDELNYINILNLLELAANENVNNFKCSLRENVFNNTNVLDKPKLWSLLFFHKSIAINRMVVS